MVSIKSAQSWAKLRACLKLGSMICFFAVELSDLDANIPIWTFFVFFASWVAKILFSEAWGLPKYLSKYQRLWLVVESLTSPRTRFSSHTLETVWAKKTKMEATWLTFGLLGHRTGWSPCAHSMGNLFFSGDIVDSFSPLELPPPAAWKSGTIGKDFKKRTQPTLAPSWSSQSSHHHILFTDRQKQFFFFWRDGIYAIYIYVHTTSVRVLVAKSGSPWKPI